MEIIDRSQGKEITLKFGDLTLIVRRGDAPAPSIPKVAAGSPVPKAAHTQAPAAAAIPSILEPSAPSARAVPLKAPLTGVIYRAPAPSEPAFVEVGDTVTGDDTACIIDVMKVMNLIKAPVEGKVLRIEAADGELVTKGDVILWIEPK